MKANDAAFLAFLESIADDDHPDPARVDQLLDQHAGDNQTLRKRMLAAIEPDMTPGGPDTLPPGLAAPADLLSLLPRPRTLLSPGDRLGIFHIKEFLARGGQAEIYLAEYPTSFQHLLYQFYLPTNKKLNPTNHSTSTCALKVLFSTDKLSHRETLLPILMMPTRYFLPTSKLHEEKGFSFFAMPYCPKGTLADFLKTKSPLLDRLHFLRQIAIAIDIMNGTGLHLDINPANILIRDCTTSPGDAVIGDLGLHYPTSISFFSKYDRAFRRILSPTPDTFAIGTPGYAAPEVLTKPHQVPTPAADRYAYASLFFEALTGSPTFAVESLSSYRDHILNHPIPDISTRSDLPPSLNPIFSRALALDPTKRPSSCFKLYCEVTSILHPRLPPHRPVFQPIANTQVFLLALLISILVLYFPNSTRPPLPPVPGVEPLLQPPFSPFEIVFVLFAAIFALLLYIFDHLLLPPSSWHLPSSLRHFQRHLNLWNLFALLQRILLHIRHIFIAIYYNLRRHFI